MSLLIRPIKAFNDNYIWALINDSNKQAIVIDPGQAEPVIDYLSQHQLDLIAIWITHHHHDHIGGVGQLREQFPMTHVVAHEEHGISPDQIVNEGCRVNAWKYGVQVWDVSGHTAHHLAYVLDIDGSSHVFCGDTLFSGGCGRVFTGTIEQLYASFKRLNTLPETALFYPAHEYTASNLKFGLSIEPDNTAMREALQMAEQTTAAGNATLPVSLAHERAVNVFLRVDQPSVIAGVQAQTELADTQLLTVFAALRELKNNF